MEDLFATPQFLFVELISSGLPENRRVILGRPKNASTVCILGALQRPLDLQGVFLKNSGI